MARPLRLAFGDAIYHLLGRGNARQRIFASERDQLEFLKLLKASAKRFEVSILGFVLMGAVKGSATVLERKSKFGTFEQVVGEDDEFSHEGGESEFFGFAPSEETEVERSEDRAMGGGDKCGHVKDRADLRAAAEDVALPAELATVVVKGSDAGEGGGLDIGEGTSIRTQRFRQLFKVETMRRGRIGLTHELGRFQSRTIFSLSGLF
jgi:hypothetical protein